MDTDYNTEILPGFIVLEGLDGSGTTTQAALLEERFREEGSECVRTCEPTESFIGKAVRAVLRKERDVAPGTLAKLFSVDRHNHLYHPGEGIIAHSEAGKWVISDRYLFSSLAYQTIDRPFEEVWELNRFFPLPEHLIFLDISPEDGSKRMDGRGPEREIYETLELQEEVRDNYFHVFSLYQYAKMRIHIFDATLPQEELSLLIWKKLNNPQ